MKKSIRYFIFGSCVSRDIFRFVPDNEYIISGYVTGTSILSVTTPAVPLLERNIEIESEVQKQIILDDFLKIFFSKLKKSNFDYLIIDFFNEKYDVVQLGKYSYISYFTLSKELLNAKIKLNYDSNIIRQEDLLEEWHRSLDIFVNQLLLIVNPNKIIIHEAYLSKKYLDENGKVYLFSKEQLKEVKKTNKILYLKYKYLKKLIKKAKIVKIKEKPLAFENHTWKITDLQSHYYDGFYRYYNIIYKKIKFLQFKRSLIEKIFGIKDN